MDRRKDCTSCTKVSDIMKNVPTESQLEQRETEKKKFENETVGIFRLINKQPLNHVRDILKDDFINNLINYFDNPKKIVKARVAIQKRLKTTHSEYKIEGLVTVDKFDNAPVVFDLSTKFGHVIRSIDYSYIKDGNQLEVSRAARYVINRIVCTKFTNKLARLQIDHLTKNAKMLNNNKASYYQATFKKVLGTSIGDIIDNVTQIVDPNKSTKGLEKFLKNPVWSFYEHPSPLAFDLNNNNKTERVNGIPDAEDVCGQCHHHPSSVCGKSNPNEQS
jgi:hypothetical protein